MVDILLASGRALAALFLVFLNGFFVASEFAFVRVRSTAVDEMVAEGRAGAETLQAAVSDLDQYLAATQLGITIASLALGWIGEPAVAALIEPVLSMFLPETLIHLIAVIIGFSVVTFLHVVLGELAPKTIAIAQAERIALLVAPPMRMFYYLFLPGLVVFNGAANRLTGLFGIPPASETEETLSEEELRLVLSRSGQKGYIDSDEVDMIRQIFELDDITAREVMVPRPDVITVPSDLPLSELRTFVVDHGHTRYPVLDANDDEQVVGYIDVKDILRASTSEPDSEPTAGDLARNLPVVPETTPVDELIREFQNEQRQMAAIIDEWGALEGIATIEDVVEVVVGDIRDDFDDITPEPSVTQQDDGSYVADGAVTIPDINDLLGTSFETAQYGTISGLILDELGRPPEVEDTVTLGGYDMTVDGVDGARITRIVITNTDDAAES